MMFMYLPEGLVLNLKEHIIMLRALINPKTNAEEQLRIQNADWLPLHKNHNKVSVKQN